MIRIAAILLLLTGILRGQSVVESELFRIHCDSSVSPNQKSAAKQAAHIWGLVCNRSFHPHGAGPNLDKGTLYLVAQPGMGWSIAETDVSGPWWYPNGHPTIILPLRGIIKINADNWNPLTDEFVYGQTSAFAVLLHEIGHVMGHTWPAAYNTEWGMANVANFALWWGQNGLTAYRQEFDPLATAIPLAGDGWHLSETSLPLAIMSPVLQSRSGYNPEILTRTEVQMLADLGYFVEPHFASTPITDLVNRRRFPWPATAPTYQP